MRSSYLTTIGATALVCASGAANATIVLDFEGINRTYPSFAFAQVQDFYNGPALDGVINLNPAQ